MRKARKKKKEEERKRVEKTAELKAATQIFLVSPVIGQAQTSMSAATLAGAAHTRASAKTPRQAAEQ